MRLLLLLYPWLELLSLIQLGIETSAFVAMTWVLSMIILGGGMLRYAGSSAVARLRIARQQGFLQQTLLLDDMALAIAAVLFIIPGVFSDFLGLVVLIGPIRRGITRIIVRRCTPMQAAVGEFYRQGTVVSPESAKNAADGRGEPITIEGEVTQISGDINDTE